MTNSDLWYPSLPEEEDAEDDSDLGPKETMSGWDTEPVFAIPQNFKIPNAGELLLVALHNYLNVTRDTTLEQQRERANLVTALHGVDWDAVSFALDALERGNILFSGHRQPRPGETIDHYEPRTPEDPRQTRF